MKLSELKKKYEDIYIIDDPYVLKTLFAHYISFQLSGDPVWLIITGPSGGLKSELINTLSSCKYIHALSTITGNTLVSGANLGKGKPTSLLLKLSENDMEMKGSGILSFKDFTSIMSETDQNKSLIMGQLREIYDGKYDKVFGTGHEVHWIGKVTLLAGSTHSIHRMRQQFSGLGERFLFYDLTQPDRQEAGLRSIENAGSGEILQKRLDLMEQARIYANEVIKIPKDIPQVSGELMRDMVQLAELATRARSEVVRDYRSPTKEIIEVFAPEMPTRFAGSLINMLKSLRVLNWNETGSWDTLEEDLKIINKITLDSITPSRRLAMQELAKYSVLQTKALAIKLNRPTSSLRRSVEDLVALEIAEREKGGGAEGDRWRIKPHYRDLILKFDGITNTGEELTEAVAEEDDREALLAEAEAIAQAGEVF